MAHIPNPGDPDFPSPGQLGERFCSDCGQTFHNRTGNCPVDYRHAVAVPGIRKTLYRCSYDSNFNLRIVARAFAQTALQFEGHGHVIKKTENGWADHSAWSLTEDGAKRKHLQEIERSIEAHMTGLRNAREQLTEFHAAFTDLT